MIFIYIIIAFLLGIIFIQWLIPVGDSVINLFLTQIEVWKGKKAVKLAQYQDQVSQINNKNEVKPLSAIGFTLESEEEEDDYE